MITVIIVHSGNPSFGAQKLILIQTQLKNIIGP